MSESIEISMMSITLVRLIGLITFIDLYLRTKDRNFIKLIIGFIFYSVSTAFNIIGKYSDIFTFIYGLTATLGIYFIALSSFSFFRSVSIKYYLTGAFFLTVIPTVIYLVFPNVNQNIYTVIPQTIILIGMIIHALINKDEYKARGGSSYYFIHAIMYLGIFQAISYLFIYNKFGIEYSYILTIGISVLIILYFINLQYNFVNLKLQKQNSQIIEQNRIISSNSAEIESSNSKLESANKELKKTLDLIVGRENKMIELKNEIAELKKKLRE